MAKGKKGKKKSSRNTSHMESGSSSKNNDGFFGCIPMPVMAAFFALELIFGIVFIVIGSLNIDKCNIEPMIPIWLILMGIVYIMTGVHEFIQYRMAKSRGIVSLSITGAVTLVTVALFVAGNVFVYTAWGVQPDYGHYWFENGCNMSAYMLSFVGVIVMDALFGIAIIGILFYAVFSCFGNK